MPFIKHTIASASDGKNPRPSKFALVLQSTGTPVVS